MVTDVLSLVGQKTGTVEDVNNEFKSVEGSFIDIREGLQQSAKVV